MGFVENAVLMSMMVLTINGTLWTLGLTQSLSSSDQLAFLPSGFQDYNSVDLNNSNVVSGQFGSQNESFISSDATIGAQSTPTLTQASSYFNLAFSVLSNLIFGMGFALSTAGVPMPLVWIIEIPTGIIAILGLTYLVLTGLSAIAGVFR